MSSSEDSYDYESYAIEFYEEGSGPPLIKKRARLIQAVVQNNVEVLKELLDSPKWYTVKDKYGYSLLQIAILRENVEVFDFLLSLDDFPMEIVDRQGDTALVTSLFGFVSNDIFMSDHFAIQLIKKGADVSRIGYDNNSLLHGALDRDFIEVARLLVERGIDLNRKNDEGSTPLHMCFSCSDSNLVEGVAMLLCYGADPMIRNHQNLTPFDMAALYHRNVEVLQENLFHYTFDQYTRYKIPFRVLLKLAESESPLFHQVMDHVTDVFFDDNLHNRSLELFSMKSEYLDALMQKLDFVIEEMLSVHSDNLAFVFSNKRIFVENFNMLIESDLKEEVLDFICNINKSDFMQKLVGSGMSEEAITELVCFLLSYGMIIHEIDFQIVYQKFGYCELFKILLHMDVKKTRSGSSLENVMLRLICDVTTDIEEFIKNPLLCSINDLEQLLDYCASSRLVQFCDIFPSLKNKLKKLPQVPLLVELARNAFRTYFIKRYQIKSTVQFYTLLKSLPISANHEKIITFERKLY